MDENRALLTKYKTYLERSGKSANTIKAYLYDLDKFAHWFEQTTGERFEPQVVDPREGPSCRAVTTAQRRLTGV